MKVYEKINELKGTNATAEQMLNWAEVNRIPLCCFEDELELDESIVFDDRLKQAIESSYVHDSERDKVRHFLESEY